MKANQQRALDAITIRNPADHRHAEAAHAPRETHHQRRHGRRADRRERLPNTTFTGSVDCRKKPPMPSTTTNSQPDNSGAASEEGCGERERPGDDEPRPVTVGRRSAEEPAGAAREQVDRDDRSGLRHRQAAARQHHRHERRERERGKRPQHDDRRREVRERPAYGRSAADRRVPS